MIESSAKLKFKTVKQAVMHLEMPGDVAEFLMRYLGSSSVNDLVNKLDCTKEEAHRVLSIYDVMYSQLNKEDGE